IFKHLMADCQGIGGQGCGSGTGISGRPRAGASPGCRIGSRCRYQGALADEELVSEELTCENGCCGTYRSVGSAEPAHSVPVAGALVEGSSETQADVNRELSGLMQGLAAAPKEGLHETPVYVALKLSDYRSMLSEAREKRGLEEQNNAMRAEMLVQREDLEKSATLTGKLSEALQCTICIETFSSPHTLSCGHTFCKECLVQWLAVSMMCPTCRAPVDQRPALSYTIQEMVSLVDARDAGEPAPPPSSSASSSLAAALMAVNGDRSSTPQANVFDRIFGSQHADRDQHLQQDESAPYDAGGRCSICREYPLLNGRCLNCLQSSHAELAEQLQSFQSYFDPSPDSSSQRRGNDSSMRIDDLFLNLSLVDEDESFENESPSASNVGSDTGAATERPPRMLRPASPSESSFALNEIFNMVPQPRIPAYRLAARSAVRADNDAATSSGHREAGLSRQARSSLSSSSRIPYSRSVFASSASSEETGAAAARPRAYQGSSGSTASGTSASVQARNPIRISAIMSQGQEQSHARGAASGLDSTALLERQTSIADMSRGAIRLHSGPALQPVALAPRVV
ncbi:E3 ubiquitin ligase, partial [Coemansia sp. RSA 2599]